MQKIRNLLKMAEEPFCGPPTRTELSYLPKAANELSTILRVCNGFFAFSQALRVFPLRTLPASFGLREWNSPELWRMSYERLINEEYFFAEDIFGNQFSIEDEGCFRFDAETGAKEKIPPRLMAG